MRVPGQTVTKLGNEGLVECPVVTGKYYWGEKQPSCYLGGKVTQKYRKNIFLFKSECNIITALNILRLIVCLHFYDEDKECETPQK